jgi:hypothetical protein
MPTIFSFKCSRCAEVHEGAPSFSYSSPVQYTGLSEAEKSEAHLGTDLCYIDDDRFIRVSLEIPIIGRDEPFMWGVWVSLSQSSFERYRETYDDPAEDEEYFGWFCNRLPFYPDTLNLRTLVHPRSGGIRPWLELEETDHPLSTDFHNGITIARAQEIVEYAMHRS